MNKIKTIWVLSGIPASGKSTWAKAEIMRNPKKYKRVNKDLLRLMLDNDKFDFQNEKFVLKTRDEIVENALSQGYDVIVDDTNFPIGGKHFKRMCEIAEKIGNVRVIEKYFDVTLKEALERNKNSDGIPVPENVIKNMFNKHVKGKNATCQDVFFQKTEKIPYDESLQDCIIFDVDGTLAHMQDRSPYEWHRVGEDLADENIKRLNHIIDSYNFHEYSDSLTSDRRVINIFIFTGRDGSCLEETKKWLYDNNIYYDDIFIRPAGNMEKDSVIKKRMYKENIEGKYNIIAWIDDRKKVVEMARNMGITVLQCDWGNF